MAAKILLVEDDNNLREIYEARLEAEGYTIVTAKDGEEALVIAKAEKPDLIVSDVMMPRISGFEMLDILRNTSELKYTKVVMLTALGQADDQTRATSLGADRYLVKSQVTLEDIVKAAHELIEGTPSAAPAAGNAQPPATPPQFPGPTPTPPVTPPPATPPTPAPAAPTPPPPAPNPPAAPAPTPPAVPTPPVALAPAPAPVLAQPAAPAPAAPQVPQFTVPPLIAPETTDKAEPQSPPVIPAPPVAKAPETEAQADAVPAADEQATMHTQIEDFINNNLTHPEATASSMQAAKPAQPPVPEGSPEDDALLANAVKDLAAPAVPTPPVALAPAPAPVLAQPAAPAPAPNSPVNNSVAIANKKIIQPLKSDKPGLDELLAREEAREQVTSLVQNIPATPSGPLVTEQPLAPSTMSATVNPPQQFGGPDPNSIAL